ncbi:MAG: hypothetical protein GWN00_16330, partial [Aliifodinibius sp.]|nr:hypothetical protein [Fodinibius sp.]NIV12609.1 hypothetical protein [Fodinibius sp.]NIY26315.1 hypothetical protein [Fodinibius sp.]
RLSQNWGWIESRWIVIKGKQFMEHTISLRIYSAAELSSLLRECGFRDTQVYGGLDGSAYDTSAKRLVVVGLK